MSIFSLNEVKIEQIKNVVEGNFASWPESATYGYFGGGNVTNTITYSNLVIRLDFSNEILSNPGKNFPIAITTPSCVSSSFYGYFAGGVDPAAPGRICTIYRLDFSTETLSLPGKDLPTARNNVASVSSSSYGYFGGGLQPPNISTITRLDFTNETVSDPGKNLPGVKSGIEKSTVQSNSYGYFGGGYTFPPATWYNTITRLDFSNETVSDPGKNLPSEIKDTTGTQSSYYGYFGGGASPPFPTLICTISRLDFSNETTSDPGKNFTSRATSSSVSNNFYGYFCGGNAPTPTDIISTITRLDFSNETVSDPGKNFSDVRRAFGSLSGGASLYRGAKTYGYLFGGDRFLFSPPPQIVSTILRMDFSTGSYSTGKNMPAPSKSVKLVGSNEKAYGKWNNTQVIRLDYTNETNSLFTTPSSPTSTGGEGTSSNSNYGYWLNLTRIDFSNETLSIPITQAGTFPSGRSSFITASASNLKYAYFSGGGNSSTNIHSTIHRLDFSNEVITQIGPRLAQQKYSHTGISGPLYGYFGGGYTAPPPSIVSTLQKMDFSTEVVTPMNNLGTIAYNRGGLSDNYYGYISGGFGPGPSNRSNVDRIEFSNDTRTSTTNLPIARDSHTGVSNSISSS